MFPGQKKVRDDRIKWISENVDVSKYDPYNNQHVDEIIEKLKSAGLIKKSNNFTMIPASTVRYLKQVRLSKGLK